MRSCASVAAPMSRSVPSIRTNTTASVSAGAAVHASSSRVLRSNRAGIATREARYRHTAYTSAPSTPMKMATAIAPTIRARVPIASAGGLTCGGYGAVREAQEEPARHAADRLADHWVRELSGRCVHRRSARARRDEDRGESEQRDPAEDDEPDGEVSEDLHHRGERGDRASDGLGRVPRPTLLGGAEDRDPRYGHRDRRVVRPRLDRVDLTGQLLHLRANVRESAVDLEDLVDGVRPDEKRVVARLLRLLRRE